MTAVTEEELIKLNNKLKKISEGQKDPEEAYKIFELLEQLQVTADVITKSRIAVTINELRKKISDEKLAKRGKALIKRWKVYFESQESNHKDELKKNKNLTPPSDDNNSNSCSATKLSENSAPAFKNRDMPKDEKRAKIVTVLLNSLKNGDLPEHTQDPELVATRIEAALFDRFGDVNNDYYSAARSRASNLRDKKNPDLRENVLTGAVSAERFASMTTDEMASDAMKQQRESFTKEAISEHQLSMQEGTPSDMFRCGRCGKNNCTYTQLQTRSSDEPMTTFVFCRTCGNRWKLY